MTELHQVEPRLRVALMADVRLFREGLSLVLAQRPEVHLIFTGPATPAVVHSLVRLAPAIVLVDTGAAGVAQVVLHTGAHLPGAKVVAFVLGGGDVAIARCVEAGVAGYVGSEASVDELVETMRRVSRGEFACSAPVARMLADCLRSLVAGDQSPPSRSLRDGTLTSRERQVMHLIQRDLSNKEIARELGIGVSTVKNHVHSILGKAAVERRGHLSRRPHEGFAAIEPQSILRARRI